MPRYLTVLSIWSAQELDGSEIALARVSLTLGPGDAPETIGGFFHSKSRPLIQINGQVGALI
jgi:hypothetical protein